MLKFRLIKLKRISNQTKVQIVFNLCKSEITDIKKRGCVKMHTLFFYDKAPTFPSRGFVIT